MLKFHIPFRKVESGDKEGEEAEREGAQQWLRRDEGGDGSICS